MLVTFHFSINWMSPLVDFITLCFFSIAGVPANNVLGVLYFLFAVELAARIQPFGINVFLRTKLRVPIQQ